MIIICHVQPTLAIVAEKINCYSYYTVKYMYSTKVTPVVPVQVVFSSLYQQQC